MTGNATAAVDDFVEHSLSRTPPDAYLLFVATAIALVLLFHSWYSVPILLEGFAIACQFCVLRPLQVYSSYQVYNSAHLLRSVFLRFAVAMHSTHNSQVWRLFQSFQSGHLESRRGERH
jgi:hypothetical protein